MLVRKQLNVAFLFHIPHLGPTLHPLYKETAVKEILWILVSEREIQYGQVGAHGSNRPRLNYVEGPHGYIYYIYLSHSIKNRTSLVVTAVAFLDSADSLMVPRELHSKR